MPVTFTVLGAPRSKKNSQRIIRVRGVPRIVQSKQACGWEEMAVLQLRSQWNRCTRGMADGAQPLAGNVNLRAIVYRDRAGRADLLNFLAAVSDAIEGAGIVANDDQIGGLDGSRMMIDRKNPRVEITLTEMA